MGLVAEWLVGWVAGWLVGCLAACWLVAWPAGWLVAGWLSGWLGGWMAGLVSFPMPLGVVCVGCSFCPPADLGPQQPASQAAVSLSQSAQFQPIWGDPKCLLFVCKESGLPKAQIFRYVLVGF